MGFMEGYQMTAGNRQIKLEQQRNNLALQQFAAQREDEQKRLTTASKAAEYYVKSNPDALKAMGLTDQEFANMSAAEQIGAVDGYYKSQATREVLQQIAQRQATMAADQRFADTLQQRTASSLTVPPVGSDPTGMMMFSGLPSRTATTTRVPTRDDLLAAMAAAPLSSASKEMLNYRLLQDPQNDEAMRLNAMANMLNARANFARVAGAGNVATEYPDVPNYVKVPDGKGGWKYLPNRPNSQQSLEQSRLRDRRDSIKAQLAAIEAEIARGNKKTGIDWLPGKSFNETKAELQQQLDEIDARINDLGNGNDGTPSTKSKPAGGGDLWSDFMNSRK